MPTQPYLVNGKRVPSVTTVLGRFKDAGPLMYWAWNEGREGRDYRETRDAAASAGTLAHLMVEADIRGHKPPKSADYEPETWAKANSAFRAYAEWRSQTQLVPDQTEMSLTCACHKMGGTLDTVLVQGRRSLGDWKTSNGVYQEYLCQLAAYRHLWEINHPDMPITGGFHLLRFSKSNGDFTHHFWAELDDAWRAFELMRELYDLDKRLKERL